MKCTYTVLALFAGVACVAQAVTEEEVCAQLQTRLEKQVELLSSVQDAESAKAVLAPLRENMAALAALNGQVSEDRLWLFIDNSQDIKLPLMEQLQLLSVQLYRLTMSDCFGSRELKLMIAPMVTTAEVAP